MYTARSLVKNFSGHGTLQFRDFRIFQPGFGKPKPKGFERADLDEFDWFYERNYKSIPPPRQAVGYGGISFDFEDTVLLLRLYRPGDITFSPLVIEDPHGNVATQDEYRVTHEITSGMWYDFDASECSAWDAFADSLRSAPAWKSDWFGVARRFFLYAGAKEFSIPFDEVDRVVDYAIALEACLVPERDFVGRRLRERSATLGCGNSPNDVRKLSRLLYEARSTIAHGDRLNSKQKKKLEMHRDDIETLTRAALRTSVLNLPAAALDHSQAVKSLWEIADDAKVEYLWDQFKALSVSAQRDFFKLVKKQSPGRRGLLRFLGLATASLASLVATAFIKRK